LEVQHLFRFAFLPFVGFVFYFSVVNSLPWRANGGTGNTFRSSPRLSCCATGRVRTGTDSVFRAVPRFFDDVRAMRAFGLIGLRVVGGLAGAADWHQREEKNDTKEIV
jgi:hypothetical protein